MKSLNGVDIVKVSLAKGLATLTMKPQNTITLQQLHDAVTRNGFTMKQSTATISGTLQFSGSEAQLKVSGSGDVLRLESETGATPVTANMAGKAVTLSGVLPETNKAAAPVLLKYQKLEVQQ